MTPKEAWESIKADLIDYADLIDNGNYSTDEDIKVIDELVAKAEPMKVKKVDFGLGHFEKLCPVCGEYQGFENDVRKSFEYPYCANCGQAIDWSDEK